MDRDLSIGELAKRTGVATSALRYYEELGLIPEQPTTDMMALASACPNSTHGSCLARCTSPACRAGSLRHGVRSITPPATGLDRCRRPRVAIWPTIARSPNSRRHRGSS